MFHKSIDEPFGENQLLVTLETRGAVAVMSDEYPSTRCASTCVASRLKTNRIPEPGGKTPVACLFLFLYDMEA